MKKIIIIIVIFMGYNVFSQDLPILSTTSLANPEYISEKGSYGMDTANERQQYVGLWRYNENGILFELKIELKNQSLNKIENQGIVHYYTYRDIVTLKYKLVKNGVELHNDLDLPYQEEGYNSYGVKQINYD